MNKTASKSAQGGRSVHLPRFPLTLALVGMGMLDVFIGMAELKARLGSRDPVLKAAIVTQAVTILEQFLRLVLEERLDLLHGRERMAVRIRGVRRAVWASVSRIGAVDHGFQSVKAIERLADRYGLPVLRECLEKMGGDLARLFDLRHALVHSLGAFRFDEAWHLRVAERFMHAVLAGRDRYLATAYIVEAAVMDAAGIAGRARRAAGKALEMCDRHLARAGGGGRDLWALLYRAHSLARLGRGGEAEAAYGEAAEDHPVSILPLAGMANLLVQLGRYGDAIGWYEKAAAIDPDHEAVRAGMGRALAAANDGDGIPILQYCLATVRRHSAVAPFRTEYATALAMEGRHAEAAGQYRRAIALDSGDAAAYVGLGNVLLSLGRHSEAAGMYKAGIKRSDVVVFAPHGQGRPSWSLFVRELGGAAAHRGMGRAMLKLGRPDRAVDFLYKAARLGADFDARLGLADALRASGRFADAVPAYESAAALNPDSFGARLGLARSLRASGRFADAVPAYESAAALNPDSFGARLGLAEALYASGRFADAVPAYESAAALNPDSFDARLGLADALRASGRFADAVPAYESAAALNPDSFDARLGLAEALYASGRFADAVPAYESAAALNPDSFDARLGLAEALYASGRFADAVPAYESAAALNPDSFDARLGLAEALYASGRFADAVPAYESAASLDPVNFEVCEKLGHALDKVGRYAESRDYRDKVAEMRKARVWWYRGN